MPGREEKEQETENFFEKIMKENFCNSAKEIDIQVQEAQRIPNKMDSKRTTPRQVIIKMPKMKDKERIFLKRFYLFIFRERGREGEREGEKHQCAVAYHTPPTGGNPGMCPHWELNQRPLGS